jgi:type I restriction enzyme S subunit
LLRPRVSLVTPEWIWLFFNSGAFLSQIGERTSGTGLKHIHLGDFREFRIRVPSLREQREIGDILHSFDRSVEVLNSLHSKLTKFKTGLMRDLLGGRVSVGPLLDLPRLRPERWRDHDSRARALHDAIGTNRDLVTEYTLRSHEHQL